MALGKELMEAEKLPTSILETKDVAFYYMLTD
jgi:hypothetical protein